MLEITQEILAKVNPLLDAGDTESAGKLIEAHVHENEAA